MLPTIVGELIDARRTVKQVMKSEKDGVKLSQLHIRQLALKLVGMHPGTLDLSFISQIFRNRLITDPLFTDLL